MKKCLKTILMLGLFSLSIPTALAQENRQNDNPPQAQEQPLPIPKKDQPKTGEKPEFYFTHKPINCGKGKEIFADLENQYGEVPLMFASEPTMMPDGDIIQLPTIIMINVEKGSFTILQTPPLIPKGDICVLSSGEITNIFKQNIYKMLGGKLTNISKKGIDKFYPTWYK